MDDKAKFLDLFSGRGSQITDEVITETTVTKSDSLPSNISEILCKGTPDTFRMGRDTHLQLAKVKRGLFTNQKKKKSGSQEEKKSGNFIISGLDNRVVTKTDFMAFGIAVTQVLYNQSYQSGNIETNSGLDKHLAKKLSEDMKQTMYLGDIVVTLKELCCYGYGETEPTTRQKKSMATLIAALHETPVVIKYPNGDTRETILCSTVEKYTRAEDGAVGYHLYLAPIFCSNVVRNFGEYPQDLMKRIRATTKRVTEAHYDLAELLGKQMKGSTFVRYIGELVDNLGLMETYKKDRGRTEKQLLSLFDTMRTVRLIKDYKVEYMASKGKKFFNKVTFQIATREQMLEAPRTD